MPVLTRPQHDPASHSVRVAGGPPHVEYRGVRMVILVLACLALLASTARAGQSHTTVLLDPDLTVGAGATIVDTVGVLVSRAEDAIVPVRLFEERGIARRAANITYRLLKLTYFDVPQEQWLLVVNHEVFGHGARLRERFDARIGYRIGVPAPYGRGGGSTFFRFDREPTAHELQAITVGGMETNAVAAGRIAERAVSQGRLHPRDALRYLGFELDVTAYVLGTEDELVRPGHDVFEFVRTYNAVALPLDARPVSPRGLRGEALGGLANPMLAYALLGIGRHVWNGATDLAVPVLSFAGVRYLPLMRYRLTPYGREWVLTNELAGRVRPLQANVRVGRAPAATPWGVAVRQRDVLTWGAWRIDAGVDVWRQPRLALAAGDPVTTNMTLGGAVHARAQRAIIPVPFLSQRATALLDVRVKSRGFVPGEPLRGGVVVRAGLGLPL